MYRDMPLQRAAQETRFTDDAVALVGGWARPGADVAEPRALARGKAAARKWIVRRGFDFVPAGIALLLISSMAWGPFLIPVPLAMAMLAFHVYWSHRSFKVGIFAIVGYFKMRRALVTDCGRSTTSSWHQRRKGRTCWHGMTYGT